MHSVNIAIDLFKNQHTNAGESVVCVIDNTDIFRYRFQCSTVSNGKISN